MINQDNITSLIGQDLTYRTSNSQNKMKYNLKSIDRIGDWFAVCQVVDKTKGDNGKRLKTNKVVWKTLRFDSIEK